MAASQAQVQELTNGLESLSDRMDAVLAPGLRSLAEAAEVTGEDLRNMTQAVENGWSKAAGSGRFWLQLIVALAVLGILGVPGRLCCNAVARAQTRNK